MLRHQGLQAIFGGNDPVAFATYADSAAQRFVARRFVALRLDLPAKPGEGGEGKVLRQHLHPFRAPYFQLRVLFNHVEF